jgi:hypothetical protein
MLNGKFFATLIGLIVAVLAIWNVNFESTPNVLENFGMLPSMSVKRMPGMKTQDGNVVALPTNYGLMNRDISQVTATLGSGAVMNNNEMYQTPPNFQSSLSPRFSSEGYGAYINYNLPDEQYQGVPQNPLTFGNMASENYSNEGFCASGGCGSVQSCSKGGVAPNANVNATTAMNAPHMNFQAPSYSAAENTQPSAYDVVDELPIGDMSNLGADGTVGETVVFDRFIFANQKSRLRALGDPIRGDLAIVPCTDKWFRPSVTPHLDLQQGAMAVMGGLDNGTANQTAALSLVGSGGFDDTVGGVNLGEYMDVSSQKMGFSGSATQELAFTAFP